MHLTKNLESFSGLSLALGCIVACSATTETWGPKEGGSAGRRANSAGAAGRSAEFGAGGPSRPSGGAQDASAGMPNAAAGATDAAAGTASVTGGTPNSSAGMPSAGGGAANATAGTPNATGGAAGATNVTGGTSGVAGSSASPSGRCGDAAVNAAGEECDYGKDNSDVGACTTQCKAAKCGDGLVQSGKEACDAKGTSATCDSDCTPPLCGDGVLNAAAGESCDSGTDNGKLNKCNTDCRFVCEGACPIRVDPAIASPGDGTTWATAYSSLTTALDDQWTRGGGQVWVKLGNITGPITMRKGVLIYGGFAGTETLLTARPTKQFTTLTGGLSVVTGASNARIDGFLITGGNANRVTGTPYINGGGLYNSSVDNLVVANCRFQGNQANGLGGAIYNYSSSVQIEDAVFLENSAASGGAIYNNSSNGVKILRSRFETNTASTAGGGLYNSSSNASVADSAFVANTATGSTTAKGGGVYNSSSSPSFVNVLFYQNKAFTGGGMLNAATVTGAAKISNCLFAANVNSDATAASAGGLLDLESAASAIVGTTFVFNTGPQGLNLTGTANTTCTNCALITKSSAGKNHNLTGTGQLTTSCVMLLGVMGAPTNPFVSPESDADGDGIPEYLLTQLDTNACVDSGTDSVSTSAGIEWNTRTTSSNGCMDIAPVDLGFHYPTSNTQSCK